MIGYNTLQKSMNGVKVLTDGVSFISDGNAEHQNIVYTEYITSDSGQTTLSSDGLITDSIVCDSIDCQTFDASDVQANSIEAKYLKIINQLTSSILFEVDGITQNKIIANVQMTLNNILQLINADIQQTQTGRIYQQGTNNNYLKDTYINGYLEVASNITQSGGSTSLKDLTIDNLTMRTDKGILQSGTNVTNSLGGTTTIKTLVVTDSVVLPANIEVPDFTTNDDIIMQSDAVIIQDVTTVTTNKNILRATKTLDFEVDGNFTQIKAGAIATLKNAIIQGTTQLQGDITQTAGNSVFNTISCNNITLNTDQIITQSGTGYIIQSGTGINTFKAITMLINTNITQSGTGIISQALSGINVFSHLRCAGWAIIGGRNNTTYTNTQNIQNNNGIQFQFNRDNSTQYSFIMNNRSSGGNGGFRFQRYIAGVYLDEPFLIDDNITMNKNLSIPGGSLTCASATIGNISQTELNCLDNCAQNINDKFTSLDSQISSLQNSSSNYSTALTGITYTSATDTTLIDNNVTISTGKNLLVGTTNIITAINNINSTLSGISYDSTNDLTTVNNHMILPTGNNFFLGTGYNVKTNIDDCILKLSGVTYTSASDTTNIDNNVQITAGKKLYIGTMDVEAEINALDTSFTTGTINSTDLTTTNLYVNGAVRLNQTSGTTFIYSDLRLINVSTKNVNQFAQLYCGGLNWDNVLYRPNGNYTLFIRNTADTANIQYLNVNSTSFNVKNTNVLIDNNLTVNGTTTLNDNVSFNDTLNVFKMAVNPTYTYSKTLGTSNVLVASVLIPVDFNQRIIIDVPVSVYRSGTTNNSGSVVIRHFETLSSITAYYTKNDVFVSNLTVTTNNTLPATKQYNYISSPYNYEQYFTNATCNFLPSLDRTNTTTYKVYFTFTFSYSTDIADNAGTTSGYYVNTSVSNTQGTTLFITSSGSNFATTSFTLSPFDVNYMSGNNNSQLQINDLISNNISNQNTIKTNDLISNAINTTTLSSTTINNSGTTTTNIISSSSINNSGGITTNTTTVTANATINNNLYVKNNIKSKSLIPGYLFDGSNSFLCYPIPCSMKGFRPADVDDYFLINPGFYFAVYENDNYGGNQFILSNDSDSPIVYPATNINRIGSIKVLYRNQSGDSYTEINMSYIS